MCYGVLVAADAEAEWLLSWWWENYRQENRLPVCFADLGMSEKALAWCEERGTVVPVSIPGYKVAEKDTVNPKKWLEWEKNLSPFWEHRFAWFKKPFALLNTPFETTLWLDLDCEIMDSLDPIFDYLASQMALVRLEDEESGAPYYNSGVIAYKKNAPLLIRWAEACLKENHSFMGDQNVLSHLIHTERFAVDELPEIYNWLMYRGVHMGAKILHWSANWGKEYIRKHGGLRSQYGKFTNHSWD